MDALCFGRLPLTSSTMRLSRDPLPHRGKTKNNFTPSIHLNFLIVFSFDNVISKQQSPFCHYSHFSAPIVEEYVPAAHELHNVEPIAEEYVPIGHEIQLSTEVAPIVEEYVPARHRLQLSTEVAPIAVECVPAGHLKQEV